MPDLNCVFRRLIHQIRDSLGSKSMSFPIYRASSETITISKSNAMKGMDAFSVVVPYCEIGGFPQMIENKNLHT